jgi:hypothetical protein
MQASKIEIEQVYAIGDDDNLKRFKVTAINTRRTTRGTANTKSTIEGYILKEDRSEHDVEGTITIDPDYVRGPWNTYPALVARQKQEAQKRAAQAHAEKSLRQRAAGLLHGLLKLEQGNVDVEAYYGGVYVKDDVLSAFIALLEKLARG